MNANEAKQQLCQRDATIDRTMIHFANLNNGPKPVWWLEIPRRKLANLTPVHIHLLLYDLHAAILYHLAIPIRYLHDHADQLAVRDDIDHICLELTTTRDATMFRDQRPTGGGVEFRQFLHYCFGCSSP